MESDSEISTKSDRASINQCIMVIMLTSEAYGLYGMQLALRELGYMPGFSIQGFRIRMSQIHWQLCNNIVALTIILQTRKQKIRK